MKRLLIVALASAFLGSLQAAALPTTPHAAATPCEALSLAASPVAEIRPRLRVQGAFNKIVERRVNLSLRQKVLDLFNATDKDGKFIHRDTLKAYGPRNENRMLQSICSAVFQPYGPDDLEADCKRFSTRLKRAKRLFYEEATAAGCNISAWIVDLGLQMLECLVTAANREDWSETFVWLAASCWAVKELNKKFPHINITGYEEIDALCGMYNWYCPGSKGNLAVSARIAELTKLELEAREASLK